MSDGDDLPPLRDVIRRHGLAAKKSLGQNFLLDLNLTGRIARAAGPLDGVDRDRDRPGPRRPDPRAARRRRPPRDRDRARRARHRGARGDRGALSRAARRRRRRRARVRSQAVSRRRTRPHRRQPALQHRHRAAGLLADRRALAALVRPPGADVPARGRRAHRRPARQQDLWPALGAGRLARRRRKSCSTSIRPTSCRRRR